VEAEPAAGPVPPTDTPGMPDANPGGSGT